MSKSECHMKGSRDTALHFTRCSHENSLGDGIIRILILLVAVVSIGSNGAADDPKIPPGSGCEHCPDGTIHGEWTPPPGPVDPKGPPPAPPETIGGIFGTGPIPDVCLQWNAETFPERIHWLASDVDVCVRSDGSYTPFYSPVTYNWTLPDGSPAPGEQDGPWFWFDPPRPTKDEDYCTTYTITVTASDEDAPCGSHGEEVSETFTRWVYACFFDSVADASTSTINNVMYSHSLWGANIPVTTAVTFNRDVGVAFHSCNGNVSITGIYGKQPSGDLDALVTGGYATVNTIKIEYRYRTTNLDTGSVQTSQWYGTNACPQPDYSCGTVFVNYDCRTESVSVQFKFFISFTTTYLTHQPPGPTILYSDFQGFTIDLPCNYCCDDEPYECLGCPN